MNYAKIENGVCTNTAVFEDEETAVDFGYPVLILDVYGIGRVRWRNLDKVDAACAGAAIQNRNLNRMYGTSLPRQSEKG